MDKKAVGKVLEICLYPIKSCQPVCLQEAECTHSGLFSKENSQIGDRHFMLVKNSNGMFMTQRAYSKMALVGTSIKDDMLQVTYPGMEDLLVPVPEEASSDFRQFHNVKVWDERVGGLSCGEEASAWFSKALNKPITLLYAGSQNRRDRREICGHAEDKLAYQDYLPYLILGDASVKDLNSRLKEPVGTRNFRPNILIQTTEPYEEDNWKEIQIGSAKFKNIRNCDRCTLPTVNPDTGVKNPDGEPLKTLKTYRIKPEVNTTAPCLGTQVSIAEPGQISVGDTVYAS